MVQDIAIDLDVPIVNPQDGTPTVAFEDILSSISTTGTVSTSNTEALDRQVNYPRPQPKSDTEFLDRQINYPRPTQIAGLRKDVDDLMAQIPRPVPSHSKNSAEIEAIMRQMTTQWRALLAPIKQRLDALEAMG